MSKIISTSSVEARIHVNGGGTFEWLSPNNWVDTDAYTTGYWVASTGYELKVANLEMLNLDVVGEVFTNSGSGSGFVGFWFNAEDRMWYVDRSVHFVNYDSAWFYAKSGNQLAIWDILNKREVTL